MGIVTLGLVPTYKVVDSNECGIRYKVEINFGNYGQHNCC